MEGLHNIAASVSARRKRRQPLILAPFTRGQSARIDRYCAPSLRVGKDEAPAQYTRDEPGTSGFPSGTCGEGESATIL